MRRIFATAVATGAVLAVMAAPAMAGNTSADGACVIKGHTDYGKPVNLLGQNMKWSFTSDPEESTCYGSVNGELVPSSRVLLQGGGEGWISCGILTNTFNGKGQIEFLDVPGSKPLKFRFDLIAAAAQNVVPIRGQKSGDAVAHASFLGQQDPLGTLQGCMAGEGVERLQFRLNLKTITPLVG